MARITVEDCLLHVKNRFELVLIAAKRARMLSKNPTLSGIEWGRDKPPVVALREVAANYVGKNILDSDSDTESEQDENYQEQEVSDE